MVLAWLGMLHDICSEYDKIMSTLKNANIWVSSHVVRGKKRVLWGYETIKSVKNVIDGSSRVFWKDEVWELPGAFCLLVYFVT